MDNMTTSEFLADRQNCKASGPLLDNPALRLVLNSLDADLQAACFGLPWHSVPWNDLLQAQSFRLQRELLAEMRRKNALS